MAHHRMKGVKKPKQATVKPKPGEKAVRKQKASMLRAGPSATLERRRRRDRKRSKEQAAAAGKDADVMAIDAAKQAAAGRGSKSVKRAEKQAAFLLKKKIEKEKPQTAATKMSKKDAKINSMLERRHRSLYNPCDAILLVGEGNFSFSNVLCEALNEKKGGADNVIATCFDGEAALNKKYPDAAAARKAVEAAGGTTLTGVDARQLHKVREFRTGFKRIVFNFPHIGGGESDMVKSVADHVDLLTAFFQSAERCLSSDVDAMIHVSLKIGEPYKSWKVVQVFRAACPDMDLYDVHQFSFSAWPGYEHRRTQGFDERLSKRENVELAKGAKIYVFARKNAQGGLGARAPKQKGAE